MGVESCQVKMDAEKEDLDKTVVATSGLVEEFRCVFLPHAVDRSRVLRSLIAFFQDIIISCLMIDN
jgi:hypothetical protein